MMIGNMLTIVSVLMITAGDLRHCNKHEDGGGYDHGHCTGCGGAKTLKAT